MFSHAIFFLYGIYIDSGPFTAENIFFVELQVRGLILRALVNFLLLPWPSFVVDHKLETRKHHLSSFVNSFTSEVRKIDVQALADDKGMQETSKCEINMYMY